jgi:hypothetical protein
MLVLITPILFAKATMTNIPYAADWGRTDNTSAFRAFHLWATAFIATTNKTDKTQLLSNGVLLAGERRRALALLIKTDPQKAIALTIPASIRLQLPKEVLNEVEHRVSGIGDYVVRAALALKGGPPVEPIQRFVHLDGKTYTAYVYGRRLGETCKSGIPLHGVVLDDVMAVHENALCELNADEVLHASSQFIDLRTAAERSRDDTRKLFAELNGKLYCGTSERLQFLETRIQTHESLIGPNSSQLGADIMDVSEESLTNGTTLKSLPTPWTTNLKSVLVIRIDFSDLPGDPVGHADQVTYTAQYVQNLADTQIAPYYLRSSYGLTSLSNTVTTHVYRMPHPSDYYATNYYDSQLHSDARSAASGEYVLNTYDRIIVLYSWLGNIAGSHINYAGMAEVGGPNVWINGEFDFRVVAHELGHTYGLWHANLWHVIDGNAISPAGTDQDGNYFGNSGDNYGDYFDTMGFGRNDMLTDFNPWFKNILGWIRDSQIQTITTNSIYRLYAFDSHNYAAAPGELLALKVIKDNTHNYYISCRCNYADSTLVTRGAYIIWGYGDTRASDLLDMTTPGTNVQDAALGIGDIFNDPAANITIRPVMLGGASPNQWLDVGIWFGPIPLLQPMITSPPSDQIVSLGESATYVIKASGSPAPNYQWQREPIGSTVWVNVNDDGNYWGAGTSSLTIRQPDLAASGFKFRCIVTNSAGSVTSSPPVLLTITPALVVTTLAGRTNTFGHIDGTGTNAIFYYPHGIAVDATGTNIYVSDWYTGYIRKLTPLGAVSSLARLYTPEGITIDSAGNLYVAENSGHKIRKITKQGIVSLIAGGGTAGMVDGTGPNALFNAPEGVAIVNNSLIFVADSGNNMIRRIALDATGANCIVTTIAGSTNSGSIDGNGRDARFYCPTGIAADSMTNVYVADLKNAQIRKLCVDSSGTNWIVSTIAGAPYAGGTYGSRDGIGTNAQFIAPWAMAIDTIGTLYVCDYNAVRTLTVDSTGTNWTTHTIAGSVDNRGISDGTGTNALFWNPMGIAADNSGNIYIADSRNNTVRIGSFASVFVPKMHTTYANKQMVVSWPIATKPFALQTTTDLLSGDWTPTSSTPLIYNGQKYFTNTVVGKAMFYRLRQD